MKNIVRPILVFVLLMIMTCYFHWQGSQWDMTSDKRYSLSLETKKLITQLPAETQMIVLLTGDIPVSFRQYQDYLERFLFQIQRLNPDIEIIYKDPTDGSAEEIRQFKQYLQSYGVKPITRRVQQGESLNQSVIYPFIAIQNEQRTIFIDLFEDKAPQQSEEAHLLASQNALEYKVSRATRDLLSQETGLAAVIGDQNHLFARGLNQESRTLGNYFFYPLTAQRALQATDSLSFVCVTAKQNKLTQADLFAIDQMAMHGVPILWFVDKYSATLDSVAKYGEYVAVPQTLAIEDYLFRNGVRLSTELLADIRCSPVVQTVGVQGGDPQMAKIPFPFHALASAPDSIFNLSQGVNLQFATPLELVKTKYPKEKEVLLRSSSNSRLFPSPVPLSFNQLRTKPKESNYNQSPQPLALLLHGQQDSYFQNRMGEDEKEILNYTYQDYIATSQNTTLGVISDFDFTLPHIGRDGSLYPIGYNPWDRQMYKDNVRFLAQMIEYMLHGSDILQLQKREISANLFNKSKFSKSKISYYLMILLPGLILMSLLTISVIFYRKRKYS